MIIGLIILIAGFGYSVITDYSSDMEVERDEDVDIYTDNLLSSYEVGGRLSYHLFISEEGPAVDSEGRDGRSAKLILMVFDSPDQEKYVPDRGTVENHQDKPSSSARRIVSIDMGDGSVVPGILEVIIYE